jgi:AcrR family transcriptional regulator
MTDRVETEGPEPVGLRARKTRETRARISSVALARFARDGFAATTINDIADEAGIATRTFFYYFDTKEDVVLGDLMDRLARLVDDLRAQPAELPPLKALWNAMELLADEFDASPDAQERYRLVVLEPSVNARALDLQIAWEDQIATELASRFKGRDREAQAHVVVAFGLGGFRTSARRSITTGRPLRKLLDDSLNALCSATAAVCAQRPAR